GGGDDDLPGAAAEVRSGLVAVGESAGRLQHDVDADLAPRQAGGVALGEHLHQGATDIETTVCDAHVQRELAVDRVILEEVGQGGGVGRVVDRDEVDVVVTGCLGGPDHITADPAETIDANSNLAHLDTLVLGR